MKRQTRSILYHLLPIAFWLLAAGGSVLFYREWNGYVASLLVLASFYIITHIPRHTSAEEPSFRASLLVAIAAYWIPSAIFLIPAIWIYLIYKMLLSFRAIIASLIGVAVVAIWIAVLNYLSIFNFQFSLAYNVRAWLPVGAFLLAAIGSTIVRQNLRVR